MLVLTRKPGEKIIFPGVNLEISVLQVRGCRVRVGITAPRHVAVHREELLRESLSPSQQQDGQKDGLCDAVS